MDVILYCQKIESVTYLQKCGEKEEQSKLPQKTNIIQITKLYS